MSELTDKFLRSRYLSFFQERAHAIIPSSSLIPEHDPSVLFTTAGMHPLTPYLQGQPNPVGKRLTSCQKCIRTNDIEEVGNSTHLTFFEMLGNWSLGDYFKNESIRWSFEFLTDPDCLGIPPEFIHVSVFAGDESAPRDEEAAAIWQSVGIPPKHIVYLPKEHNWWSSGSDGPCGPDSEIFIDTVCLRGGTSDDKAVPGVDTSGRYVEIWNNVFMCYNRSGSELTKLPTHNVDTGMGLERTLAVLTEAASVYETSCFRPIVDGILARSEARKNQCDADPNLMRALRIVSDHLRTSVFILGDENGVTPSNQGQGYVLRRLVRRALRFCDRLRLSSDGFVDSAQTVIEHYASVYPELERNSDRIESELKDETARFTKVLGKGVGILNRQIAHSKDAGKQILPGDFVFRLYDTYGFPVEFTKELASEQGMAINREDFETRWKQHRERSKSESAKSGLADQSEQSVRYHTATHLLHAALRDVLGEHVVQRGSNITRERMRFDFSHSRAITPEEQDAVEKWVQAAIDAELEVTSEVMRYDQAKSSGAIGLFEDRYGNEVSVYSIGGVSKEVCAGPHVSNTRELGRLKIVKEQSAGAGVRRIRAALSK